MKLDLKNVLAMLAAGIIGSCGKAEAHEWQAYECASLGHFAHFIVDEREIAAKQSGQSFAMHAPLKPKYQQAVKTLAQAFIEDADAHMPGLAWVQDDEDKEAVLRMMRLIWTDAEHHNGDFWQKSAEQDCLRWV